VTQGGGFTELVWMGCACLCKGN